MPSAFAVGLLRGIARIRPTLVGRAVLGKLLQQGRRVVCLVRAACNASATQRLGTQSGVAIAGDLALRRFGLAPSAFAELASRITHIVHCGVIVNHALPYSAYRSTNVLGTIEAY